ncbi:dihydroorotate dehydrogenase (NAD+) catalytic subunit [Paenibacillus uliginis N3/975]|uniref:Dihydroorotate dehydrogenase n=1 Tax=Paenibacillus uliginis N3/975 TaxID=1313296 RepID=A0A1X7HGH4_9BACL|nr:dihydroorotate dehydrogenase [Paenibacillus uliginis]SMF86220.1 dihydroorotate dehydrogenase (NAD+) catalytic subunit [Paenibacillus uliginis N3/975]
MTDLSCVIAGVTFKNPVMMASGTFGFGHEYSQFYPIDILGGICGKGLTLQPKEGNPGVRVWETASGMLNSVGLENPGVHTFLEQECPYWETLDTVRIANLGGGCLEDYIEGARLIQTDENNRRKQGRSAVDMIELNISCPNVKEGGMAFGIQTEEAQKVVRAVRREVTMPLIVKLSPGAERLTEMAYMCELEGADAVSLINTISAMKIDVRLRKSVFRHGYAGLSGPAIKPIALRMVHQVSHAVNIPVIGIGGISSGEDIMEFIMAGAAAVEVGTAGFSDLRAGVRLINELETFMAAEKISHLDEVRGIV